LSHPHSFNDSCSNCERWKLERVKVRKSRWNDSVFNFKCDYGPLTNDFYLSIEGDVEISDGGMKCSVDAPLIQTMSKRRAPLDYKEKELNEFKVAGNLYCIGWYNNNIEGVNCDYFSDVSSPDAIHRDHGCPVKVSNHRSTVRFQQRCKELTVMVAIANEGGIELVSQVS
jgi:hypothetical protein